jgi:hypothetical protein
MKKNTARRNRKDWGRMSHALTRDESPRVTSQKKRMETMRGVVTVAASLYVR